MCSKMKDLLYNFFLLNEFKKKIYYTIFFFTFLESKI